MFVASSLDWWKGNLFWAVFKKAKKPPTGYERLRQVPKDERIAQEVSEIWLEHLGQHVAFVGTGHDRHGADNFNWYIVRYVFSDTEIKFERQVVSKDTAAAVERWPTITKVKPAIYGVLLADLLENPDVQWRRIDFSDAAPDPDGYYIARSDVDRVRQIKDFTPQIALKRLDRILDNENVEPNKPEVQQLPRISPK